MVNVETNVKHKGKFVERVEPRRSIAHHDVLADDLILRKEAEILKLRIDL